jgi:hypothetical protein
MQVVFVNLLMRSKGLKVATTLILAAIAVIVAYLVNQLPPLQALPGGLWVLIGVIVLMTLLTVALQLLGGESTKNQTSGAPNSLRSRLLKAELEEVDLRRRDSLHQQITQELNLIDVDFANHPEQVGRPSELLVNPEFVANDGTVTALPSNQKMSEVFHRVGGRLLILGEPGPGKTTQLLELAKSLLEEAKTDLDAPVAIILELSAWKGDLSIADWLPVALKQKYSLNPKISREWLRDGRILPLLNGLDELGLERQRKAIVAINQYLESDRALDLVVCCRWSESKTNSSLPGLVIEEMQPDWLDKSKQRQYGLIFGLIFGLKTDLKNKSAPNQGILASAKNVLIFMPAFTAIFLVAWQLFNPLVQLAVRSVSEGIFASSFANVIWVSFYATGGRAITQHFALRIVLTLNHYTPWNYAKFLDYAAELRFIQRIGGRYRFIHRLLMEHFADMRESEG